jgi:hypothetical protein
MDESESVNRQVSRDVEVAWLTSQLLDERRAVRRCCLEVPAYTRLQPADGRMRRQVGASSLDEHNLPCIQPAMLEMYRFTIYHAEQNQSDLQIVPT